MPAPAKLFKNLPTKPTNKKGNNQMNTTIQGDFPYEEIRRPDGNYFQSWKEAKDAGYDDDQIWSVTSAEGDDGSEWIITGPPHHFCNHLGHLATRSGTTTTPITRNAGSPQRKPQKGRNKI
jgi:hypothetical protein